MNNQLKNKSDYLYCEDIIKKHSKSFYFAFSNLPRQKAQAVYAVYAFCRLADDTVDENSTQEDQIEALNKMERNLLLFEQGESIDHPLWRALRDVFNQFEIDIQPFYDQLKGQRMDINFISPNTLEELEHYSTLVAGTVGLMLLPIIASNTKIDLTDTAIDLGIAMQITNILRDIGEDQKNKNRVYLPLVEMHKASYSLYDLRQSNINQAFINLWENLAQNAEARYDQFEKMLSHFDTDSQDPVITSARVYREILNAVRKNNYDCFTKRNFVSEEYMKNLNSTTFSNG